MLNNNKNMILLTPYMMELIDGHIPFIVFYDNDQLLKGDEVYDYEQSNPLLDGELKGYWDKIENCYYLVEPGVHETAIYFDLLTETGLKGYLEGLGFEVYDNYKDFRKVYTRKVNPSREMPYTVQYRVGPCYNFFGFKTEEEAEEYIKKDSRNVKEYLEMKYPCVKHEDYISEYGYKSTKVWAEGTDKIMSWIRIYK